jgi:hypothetical protein
VIRQTRERKETRGILPRSAEAFSSSAGISGLSPHARSSAIRWLLALLLTALTIASLQRARMRQTILGCVVALILLINISGCGSEGNRNIAPISPGTYAFTLQATSGNIVRNTLLTLVVK